METKDLLIEIGTEELPPKALKRLAMAFADEIRSGLDDQSLTFDAINWYATPRRLAVIVQQLAASQEDRDITRRGPALAAAFDQDGNPTRAAEGFAGSCGVGVDKLETLETDKGSWLVFNAFEKGKVSAELIPEIIKKALGNYPSPNACAGETGMLNLSGPCTGRLYCWEMRLCPVLSWTLPPIMSPTVIASTIQNLSVCDPQKTI